MATKKELQGQIIQLEQELANDENNATQFRPWSKLSIKALEEYIAFLESEKSAGESTDETEDKNDTPETTPETKETPDPAAPAEPTKETMLVKCAIDNDLFSGTLWSQTGLVINSASEQFRNKKIPEMSKEFAKLLDKNVDKSLIPEKGPDRNGDEIVLRKSSGAVKWSSWQVTARIVQNCSNIYKGIEALGYDTVFPGGILIPRSQLDKLLKAIDDDKDPEPPVKTVLRSVELATKKIAAIETVEDLVSCDEFIQFLNEAFRQRLQELKPKK